MVPTPGRDVVTTHAGRHGEGQHHVLDVDGRVDESGTAAAFEVWLERRDGTGGQAGQSCEVRAREDAGEAEVVALHVEHEVEEAHDAVRALAELRGVVLDPRDVVLEDRRRDLLGGPARPASRVCRSDKYPRYPSDMLRREDSGPSFALSVSRSVVPPVDSRWTDAFGRCITGWHGPTCCTCSDQEKRHRTTRRGTRQHERSWSRNA